MPAQNYVLLERVEVGEALPSSITFSNIPQTGYTDLKMVISARGTYAAQYAQGSLTFNNTVTGYSGKLVVNASATTATSYSQATTDIRFDMPGASNTASTFSNVEVYITNYTSSNYKSVSIDAVEYESNTTTNWSDALFAQLWSNTAAITSIKYAILNASSYLVQGSTFSLYGLAASNVTPAIAPKASGGSIIQTDGTYWYHAFLASGTFTPATALSCDVLALAGGGGGGGSGVYYLGTGGGGAGGLLYLTSQSIGATAQTVTVGAGGAVSTNGGNSQVGSLTAAVGGGKGADGNAGVGANGGSGGGSSGVLTKSSGTAGQGNSGGNGPDIGFNGSGGGGGAGAAGGVTTGTTGAAGGAGVNTYSSWLSAVGVGGVSGYLAGGGGGGGYSYNSTSGGAGGAGGGGSASGSGGGVATVLTGGGGGGSWTTGGAGGSGIVIIRYAI